MSRYGMWHNNLKPEVEVFVTEETAKEFAISLRNAFTLVRNTSSEDTEVTVKEQV